MYGNTVWVVRSLCGLRELDVMAVLLLVPVMSIMATVALKLT